MRALLSVEPGGPESLVLDEVDLPPEISAGHVRVAIHACAVNYPDVLLISDRYQRRPPRPFAPGMDIAGVVEAVAADVRHLRVGDRVMAQLEHGGMAEYADVHENRCATLPVSLSFDDAAAMLTTYGTARFALEDCGRLGPGATLLVLGAAGGVGLAAVDVGKALGARVIAAASSVDKIAVAKQKGADAGVVYPSGASGYCNLQGVRHAGSGGLRRGDRARRNSRRRWRRVCRGCAAHHRAPWTISGRRVRSWHSTGAAEPGFVEIRQHRRRGLVRRSRRPSGLAAPPARRCS